LKWTHPSAVVIDTVVKNDVKSLPSSFKRTASSETYFQVTLTLTELGLRVDDSDFAALIFKHWIYIRIEALITLNRKCKRQKSETHGRKVMHVLTFTKERRDGKGDSASRMMVRRRDDGVRRTFSQGIGY